MPCFASDFYVCAGDLQLLRGVARGQKQALSQAVDRFYPVVMAILYHRLKDFSAAERSVEGVLAGLMRSLLNAELEAEEFAREADRRSAAVSEREQVSAAGGEALHGLHAARKLVRRRAGVEAIHELPLAQLMALVLRYYAAWSTAQMVGIVAESPDGVREALMRGHRAVVDAMRVEG